MQQVQNTISISYRINLLHYEGIQSWTELIKAAGWTHGNTETQTQSFWGQMRVLPSTGKQQEESI